MQCLSRLGIFALLAATGLVGCKQATITAPVGEPLAREALEPLVGVWDSEDEGDLPCTVELGKNGKLYLAFLEFDDKKGEFETLTMEVTLCRLKGKDFAFMRATNLEEKGPSLISFAHVVRFDSNKFVWRNPNFDAFAAAVKEDGKFGRFLINEEAKETPDDPKRVEVKGDAELFWEIIESQGLDVCFPEENEATLYRRKETRPVVGQQR